MLDIIATCVVITAVLAYLNDRFVGLPTTIGVMVAALALSLVLVGLDALGASAELHRYEKSFIRSIDFSSVLMQGMLSLLLFAAALQVDMPALSDYRWPVAALAIVGTLLSTVIVGVGLWLALSLAGLALPLLYCLLFGALISPTDPVAVIAIIKSAGAPKELELVMAGESLFNDGVGVVMFSLLAGVLVSGVTPTPGDALVLLLKVAGGGVLFGLLLGYATFRLLKSIDNHQVEVLLTLATVFGGSAAAGALHVSGPLAMVVAGLIVGNEGREFAMSENTRHYLDVFWELIDEILNAVLFVLLGMEVLLIVFSPNELIAAVAAIAVTLAARLLSVGLPIRLMERGFRLPRGSWKVLTWGGLRGGISVALALSLPASHGRDTIVALTYCVVVFSILVQGVTIGHVTRITLARARTHAT